MQYQLSIRKVNESDLSVNRPFMPEDEDYEMYLSAFIEDVQKLECVTELITNGNGLVIAIKNESDFEQLHTAVKHLLNNSFHDKLVSDSGFSKVA
ncbi:hypothetical protein [Shewanella sp. 10N.286.48.A6]|uniref:hypothetical protein n=1 Tax=Shewanella sp. 10N.286.48.A6 TaxID=1880833 RepID=UPI000C82F76F|nr:hypothetical protein [Shewanella sp. 10N.286.48.A6]PMI03269.1 hypothetical protein BCU55_01090 [Shewanella sp. 10N.286.48.A6]